MNSRLLWIVLVLFGTLLLAGCSVRAAPTPVVPYGAQAGEITGLEECEFQAPVTKATYAAECGTLVVPERWEKSGSRLITLPVVRIPASGPNPAEPVFWLVGGPGGSNLSWAPPDWLLKKHDVVMVGYRGVDGTVTLACPEVGRLLKAHLGKDLLSEQARLAYVAATKACAATHQEAGVDLSGYTIPGVVEDMEAARIALGYGRINLFSESYGTRVAQIYAYLHPDSLHRLVLIGVNTPGHFMYNPAVLDEMIRHLSELCAQDETCSSRTSDLAQTMYNVNHNMAKRWLVFNIDSDTIRLGTQMMLYANSDMTMIFDAYLAAAAGDPSGLALLNLMARLMFPADRLVFGDTFSKGGTADLEKYGGIESISLGNSILGAPHSELVWPMAKEWPIELIPEELRDFQESEVEMLLVNGTVDFSTPPTALDEAKPYYHKAQMVLLPEFSHVDDEYTLQPAAFERLITSYYDTGVADDSLYVYQPLSFNMMIGPTVVAKLLVAAVVLLPVLLILGVVLVMRRLRRWRTIERIRRSPELSTTTITTMILTLVLLFSAVRPAAAQDNRVAAQSHVPAAPSQQGPTDPAELESFLDELLGKQMEEHHIAGAAVAVVKDGALFFAKGYGYADLEEGIPVDPEQTGFRIGSVTKLFTWTAVMQLVEQGKLDLDADVNIYLDFRVPDTYPQPITLKHLLTHTAGFEDGYVEFLALDGKELVPWREWMVSHMPTRVRPPGDRPAYSNYGASLAGYIVARVSGQPYDQYIQEHILNPLGMAHTTAQSPLPAELRAQATVGYMYVDATFQTFPALIGQPAIVPAGAMLASATDIGRFMIAHLQGGRYGDDNITEARILKESTARQMHSTLYTDDPRLLGTAYGFFDFSDNGQRTIGHSGEAEPINSLLLLLPDQKLGVFVTYNSMGGGELTNQHLGFQRAFFDHYYPAPAVEPIEAPEDFAGRAGRFAGSYRITRNAYTTLEKFIGFFGAGTVEISDPGDGTLLLATPWGEWYFVEVEPLYFRQVDAPFGMAFREDGRGNITYMNTDFTPMHGFEKLNWYETSVFNIALLLGCVLLFLSMILVALIRVVRDRRLSDDRRSASRSAVMAYWIVLGICVLNLLFVAGTYLWGDARPIFGVSTIYQIVLGVGVLSASLTIGALIYTALAWKNGYWGIAARAYYSMVTVAAVVFVWFLNYWNLLGWRY